MSFYDLDEKSPTVKHPKGLDIKLKPHQLTSICAMRELENAGSIIIDKPTIDSGFYNTVRYKVDEDEFIDATFIVETNCAILADKVGSGKTYMMIGLILNTLVPITHNRFVLGSDHFSIRMISSKECENVNLIVVPHNLANQWATFIDNSEIKYLKLNTISDFDVFFDIDYVTEIDVTSSQKSQFVIHNRSRKKKLPTKATTTAKKQRSGSKVTPKTKQPVIYERKKLNPKKVSKILEKKQVIILNINRYKFFKQIFHSIKWARVIIDEMDSANIPNIFNEFGNFNWFLTATPTSIFYKSCRRYVNKIFGNHERLLKYFVVKNKDEYVDMSVVLPKPHVFMIPTLLQRVVSAISDLIPQDVLKLINAGNMKEAVVKLNCGMDTSENIVKVLTENINTEMHNLNAELLMVNNMIPVDRDAHEKRIKKIETDIARCKTRLNTVKERMDSVKNECCFICTESFDTPAILSCCKSVFCLKCLVASLKANNKCPYCRHPVKSNKDYHVISKTLDKSHNKPIKKTGKKFSHCDKADVLEKILCHISANEESPRILIFSDYSQTFDKIINNIAKAKLQYALLSGVPTHITNVINDFEAGTINVLMLDSQHYGSGLNLQRCTYLILYHRMTPELETQVIGRAQRFGRTSNLKIIYLVNDGENQQTKLSANPLTMDTENDLDMLINPPEIIPTGKKINKPAAIAAKPTIAAAAPANISDDVESIDTSDSLDSFENIDDFETSDVDQFKQLTKGKDKGKIVKVVKTANAAKTGKPAKLQKK